MKLKDSATHISLPKAYSKDREQSLYSINGQEVKDKVDGSNLTDNQEIKYRRKRTISEPKRPAKPVKTKEFLDFCLFLVDKASYKTQPKSAKQYLAHIRNNRIDMLPKAYQHLLEDNHDVILEAAQLKPSEVKQKVSDYLSSSTSNLLEDAPNESSLKEEPATIIKEATKIEEPETSKCHCTEEKSIDVLAEFCVFLKANGIKEITLKL